MTDTSKDIHEEEISEEALQESEWEVKNETTEWGVQSEDTQLWKLKDALTRTQADYENFKKRTDRDKADMVSFLKIDILKKILPRVDDMERMILGTPEDLRQWALYDGIIVLQKSLLKDLKSFWVESFVSKWESVNPDIHEVMTQIPGAEGIIVDEFEKWYMLGEKVLRVAKVVVGNGS
jgi:molecular chaperone GrpE